MESLSDRCYALYINGGQYAVERFIRDNYPDIPWAYCSPCESVEPIDTDNTCLVCGSLTKKGA